MGAVGKIFNVRIGSDWLGSVQKGSVPGVAPIANRRYSRLTVGASRKLGATIFVVGKGNSNSLSAALGYSRLLTAAPVFGVGDRE